MNRLATFRIKQIRLNRNLNRNIKYSQRTMHIRHIPMRWGTGDNYAYILTDDVTKASYVIDPAEPDEVLPVLQDLENEMQLAAIVNTHYHYDHSGGNEVLHQRYPSLPIIAGEESPLVTRTPRHASTWKLGQNIEITALHTPCHTQDSICYYARDLETHQKAVFTGDTLFNAGCGRFFEGSPAEMDSALNSVLGSLPGETLVYSGHEYTASNAKFAKTVLSSAAVDRLLEVVASNEFTTGLFTMDDEKAHNPFLRLDDPQVADATGIRGSGEAERTRRMAALRSLKNKL